MLRPLRTQTRKFSTSLIRSNEQISKDIFATFGKNTASKEQTDTFVSVFNKIMDQKNKDKGRSSLSPLQYILEQGPGKKNNQLSITDSSKDIRDFPLSVSSKVLKEPDSTIEKNILEDIQIKSQIRSSIEPTINYLNSIDNDYDLIEVVKTYVSIFEKLTDSKDFKPRMLTDDLFFQKIHAKSVQSPKNPMINQYTLPFILAHFLNLLSKKFYSSLEMISFFQNLKKLNIKAFTFLGTEMVYNEILESTWQSFKDIKMIDSLLSDMKANGVMGDMDTISILGLIKDDMQKLLDPYNNQYQFYSDEDYQLMKRIESYRTGLMEVL